MGARDTTGTSVARTLDDCIYSSYTLSRLNTWQTDATAYLSTFLITRSTCMKARLALRLSLLPLACLVVLALALLQARQSVAVPGSTASSPHQPNLQRTDLAVTPPP